MLGNKIGNAGKHAVVYKGMESDKLLFINNKWENEEVPSELKFTEEALREKIETELSEEWKVMQGNLLSALRQDKNHSIQLREYISIDKLQVLAQRYVELIRTELKKEKLEV